MITLTYIVQALFTILIPVSGLYALHELTKDTTHDV